MTETETESEIETETETERLTRLMSEGLMGEAKNFSWTSLAPMGVLGSSIVVSLFV
jgi:hypothetical protein